MTFLNPIARFLTDRNHKAVETSQFHLASDFDSISVLVLSCAGIIWLQIYQVFLMVSTAGI